MKNQVLFFLAGMVFTILFAFTTATFTPSRATAEVVRADGFYIFTDSKPVMEYDSLGVVELGFVSGTQYNSIRANLIQRSRKKYPQGDGLLMQLTNGGVDRCVVVKFK